MNFLWVEGDGLDEYDSGGGVHQHFEESQCGLCGVSCDAEYWNDFWFGSENASEYALCDGVHVLSGHFCGSFERCMILLPSGIWLQGGMASTAVWGTATSALNVSLTMLASSAGLTTSNAIPKAGVMPSHAHWMTSSCVTIAVCSALVVLYMSKGPLGSSTKFLKLPARNPMASPTWTRDSMMVLLAFGKYGVGSRREL